MIKKMGLGALSNKSLNTNYTASSDGFVIFTCRTHPSNNTLANYYLYANGITVGVAGCSRMAGTDYEQNGSLCVPIKSGEVWRVSSEVAVGAPTIGLQWRSLT